VKNNVIKKYGTGGASTLRYAGFLRMVLGDEMGRVGLVHARARSQARKYGHS
jgi:hypothetical protein